MIIVIGDDSEYHSHFIYNKLKEKNISVKYLDSRIYPEFNWGPEDSDNYIVLDDEKIYTEDISGIYWRWYYGVVSKNAMIYREKASALEDFLYSLEAKCWNSLQSVELHTKKGFQSKIMYDNGIRIPKTTITNDKFALEKFYIENNKSVIYKPVRGGAYTKKMEDSDLLRKDALINCPCQLQEFIDGVDIRVYAFKSGECFAGKIIANSVDFRADENAIIERIDLPENVQKDCLKILEILGLKYSGIDIRLNNAGEYVFIEANPAPMFVYFEKMSKTEITQTLIRNLQNG